MAGAGHKTMCVFQRDMLLDEGDLQEVMTALQAYSTAHPLATNRDATPSDAMISRVKDAVNPGG
jgi:hypothetical protein